MYSAVGMIKNKKEGALAHIVHIYTQWRAHLKFSGFNGLVPNYVYMFLCEGMHLFIVRKSNEKVTKSLQKFATLLQKQWENHTVTTNMILSN